MANSWFQGMSVRTKGKLVAPALQVRFGRLEFREMVTVVLPR